MSTLRKLGRIVREPGHALQVGLALLRGTYYIFYYRLFRRNVKIRFPFKAFAKVTIVGPGSVYVDRNCSVNMTLFRGLCIVTLTPQAEVRIGSNGHIGGLTIRCGSSITIGEEVWTAGVLVQDTLLVSRGLLRDGNLGERLFAPKPIVIGDNVWLAAQSVTLGGSSIGNDSVIGGGAACLNVEIGQEAVLFGNPGKRPLPIDRVLQMKGER
jgi:acetyltransferase-like isoleucine patch superfamily enzyme